MIYAPQELLQGDTRAKPVKHELNFRTALSPVTGFSLLAFCSSNNNNPNSPSSAIIPPSNVLVRGASGEGKETSKTCLNSSCRACLCYEMIYVEVIALGMRAVSCDGEVVCETILLTTRAFFAFLAVTRARERLTEKVKRKKLPQSN